MRYIIAAAAVAMSAGAAQAATVDLGYDDVTLIDLTYTMTLQATDVYFKNPLADYDSSEFYKFEYPGTKVGETETRSHTITVAEDVEGASDCPRWWDCRGYSRFDTKTGAISYSSYYGDSALQFLLSNDGTGTLKDTLDYDGGGVVFSVVEFDVLDWSVEGLPEVAPIPLPASLPLLGVGLAAVGFVGRRRKASQTA